MPLPLGLGRLCSTPPLTLSLLVALALVPTVAVAEWRVDAVADRLMDRSVHIAWVAAKQPDHGVSARLQVECLDAPLVGGRLGVLAISGRFSVGKVGLRYRFDDDPPETRILPVKPQSVTVLMHDADMDRLAAAKRFRIELSPSAGPALFYDFDVSGAGVAMRGVPCTSHRLR
jgi:hypothetical protein